MSDPWQDQSTYCCRTCRFYVPKEGVVGRCRRHAPTMQGYPVVYARDWCGDHKLGTNPSTPRAVKQEDEEAQRVARELQRQQMLPRTGTASMPAGLGTNPQGYMAEGMSKGPGA